MSSAKPGLIGRKLGMTQIFDDAGNTIGVTLVEVAPNRVLQVKSSKGKDGYAALQLGYGSQKESRITKPMRGHMAKSGTSFVRYVREMRVDEAVASKYQAGQFIEASEIFAVKDRIDVSGVSKGRGFGGVMKRHNFSGFKRTHGAHEYKRHGGSVGCRLTPGMTLGGMPMPGHYGNADVTVQNVQIVRMDKERNLLFLKGGVPGPNGAIFKLRKAAKG
jgi:large subunit ribosomal protein L3